MKTVILLFPGMLTPCANPGDAESKDVYTEISKLDDLRQRGLITDEECEAEKRELLEAN